MKCDYETPKIQKIMIAATDVIRTSFTGKDSGDADKDVPKYDTEGYW